MSIYFLFEDPKLKWRAIKKGLPKKGCDGFFVPPVKSLSPRKLEALRLKLIDGAIYFSPSGAEKAFFPFCDEKTRAFFYIALAQSVRALSEKLCFSSVCLFDADSRYALLFLSAFSRVFLSGEGARSLSDSLLETAGAAVPVVVKVPENSACIFFKEADPSVSGVAFHPDFAGDGEKFGFGNLGYAPFGRYGFISERLGRPLSCAEAARLSFYDKKATFNILTNPVFRSII